MTSMIPTFSGLSGDLADRVADLGRAWAASIDRPQVSQRVLEHWDGVLLEWASAHDAPLLVRKYGSHQFGRGSAHLHATGRTLVPVDNAPANWCLASALLGRTPTLSELIQALETGELPIAMILKRGEREAATYSGRLSGGDDVPNVNSLGWKVAHIDPVGLRTRAPITEIAIEVLQAHHVRLLSPANMFLVPKSHGGLAELPEFLAAFAS